MSYPCFRGHKAEVYKLGIDLLMCDEVRGPRSAGSCGRVYVHPRGRPAGTAAPQLAAASWA